MSTPASTSSTSTLASPDIPRGLGQHFLGGAQAAIWHKSAPAKLRRRSAVDPGEAWTVVQEHLAARRRPRPVEKILPAGVESLRWGLAEEDQPEHLAAARSERSARDMERCVLDWLADAPDGDPSVPYAIEALAWAWQLPLLSGKIGAEAWWALVDHLIGEADQAGALELESSPLVHQLLAAELPLVLACVLPELKPTRKLSRPGRNAAARGLVDLLDGEGLPHADWLALLRPLLACWTRCRMVGEHLEGSEGELRKAARTQYEWLVREALRLTRHDGSATFGPRPASGDDAALLEAALRYGGDEHDEDLAALCLPGASKSARREAARYEHPPAAVHSEWAAVAILRPDWERNTPRLGVRYPGDQVGLEFTAGKDLLLAGTWSLEVDVNGQPAQPEGEWEEVCWISDEDVDYLELELEMSQGVRVQRQMLMAREDGFLLLGDAVFAPEGGRLAYRGGLPLADECRYEPEQDSNEGWLRGTKRRGLVMPLALPEWRSLSGPGELQAIDGRLQLSMETDAHRLYAPLWVDLDRRRSAKRYTWRRLTVAEMLEVQPRHVAAGFRVAAGNEQWLLYRSLGPVGNRTLLGHNLVSEMMVGRFDADGEVEQLIEIE